MSAPLIVLAAGMATRMGTCKATIRICGASALETIVSRARAAGADPITVVTGCYEAETRAEADRLCCRTVHNPDYESGMFSSVLQGIRAVSGHDRTMLIPVDTPLVKTCTYRSVLAAFDGSGADVAYPTFRGKRGHPPVISSQLFPAILSHDGECGLRGALIRHARACIDVPSADRAVTLDMDTPDDLRALERYAARESIPDDEECDEMIDIFGTPPEVVSHMEAVASLACAICDALMEAGAELDPALVRSSARLHDIAKLSPDHASAGGMILRARGACAAADVVAQHMEISFNGSISEAEVVYLADKMTDGTRCLTIESRERSMAARYGDSAAAKGAARKLANARAIRDAVEAIIGADLSSTLSSRGITIF